MAISTAVDASAVARVVGIKTKFKDLRGGNIVFLPQRLAIIGQGNSGLTYSTTKQQVTNAQQGAELYGYGSPIHLALKQIFPINGDGVGTIPVTVYPLEDAGSSVAASGDITPTVSQTIQASYRVKINNILSEAFVISVGDSVADVVTAMTTAINAVLEMPIIASDDTTEVGITSKWKGISANDIYIEVIGSATAGTSFAISQPSGGLVNPDVQTALDQVGNVWETFVLNCLNISDVNALNAYQTFGEGRWGALVRKPLVVFTGNTAKTVSLATAISDARKTDRINGQLVAPNSQDLPFVVAARQLVRIIVLANNNPPHDYGSQAATGLVAGPDGDQWDYIQRDEAVKKGSSTIEVQDNIINLSDIITFYHPTGEKYPAYRYVVDIVKLQNSIFNLDLIFKRPAWDGAPLIPNNQPTVNPDAKRPSTAISEIAAMLDHLGLHAIISDPETAKKSILAELNSQNPKRLDVLVSVQVSGNSNIIAVDLNFGFYFGTQAVLAN